MHTKRLSSGKISHYLRPMQLVTGRYAIATSNIYPDNFTMNMNYPIFNSEKEVKEYLDLNFEKAQ